MSVPTIGFGAEAGVCIDFPTFLERRMLIQAASGAGKSTLMRAFIEQLAGHVQQWVVDREGDMVTLREAGDFVLVGRGGDVPADLKTVKVLARRLMEIGASVIFDLSELRIPDQRMYVKLLFDELTHMPRALWHPLVVWLDEGHMFAPEKESALSLAAVVDAASLWRKRGYCLALATQRLSKLDKDVAAELHNKLIGYTDDVDVKRAGDQLGMTTEQRAQLQLLEPGQFYARGPAISRASVLVQAPTPKTVPPPKGQARSVAPPAPEKVRAILGKLADLAHEAEEEARTVEDLERKNVELTRRVRQLEKGGAERIVEKPVVDRAALARAVDSDRARIRSAVTRQTRMLATRADALRKIVDEISDDVRGVIDVLAHVTQEDGTTGDARAEVQVGHDKKGTGQNRPPVSTAGRSSRAPASPVVTSRSSDGSLRAGERVTLTAIAQYPDGATRDQLTVLTGYKRSSRDTYIQRLASQGYVETRGGSVFATDAGVTALGADFRPLPTGEALQEYWRGKLSGGELALLEELLVAYPDAVHRNTLGEAAGYKRSSRDTYLQRLASRKLITTASGGMVRASDTLFEET